MFGSIKEILDKCESDGRELSLRMICQTGMWMRTSLPKR